MNKPKIKGDAHLLGKAREPLVISCEQCGERLAFMLGDCEWGPGVIVCTDCIASLAKWAAHV